MYEHTDRSLCNQLILVLTQKKKNFLVSQKSTTVKQTKEKYGKTLGLSKKVQQRNSQRNNKTTWQSKPQLWQSNRKQLNINVSVPLLVLEFLPFFWCNILWELREENWSFCTSFDATSCGSWEKRKKRHMVFVSGVAEKNATPLFNTMWQLDRLKSGVENFFSTTGSRNDHDCNI